MAVGVAVVDAAVAVAVDVAVAVAVAAVVAVIAVIAAAAVDVAQKRLGSPLKMTLTLKLVDEQLLLLLKQTRNDHNSNLHVATDLQKELVYKNRID